MKKYTKTRPRPRRKPKRATADVVADMAASGLVEDEIAQRLGVHKNVLRARHINSIKTGKAVARASKADVAALTVAEYWALSAMTTAFADTEWTDPALGNLIWLDPNGKGARDIASAFAGWMARGAYFNTTGLSTRFDPKKAAEFAKVKLRFEQTHKIESK